MFQMDQGWEKGRGLPIPTLWLAYFNLGNPSGGSYEGQPRCGTGNLSKPSTGHITPAAPPDPRLLRKEEREGRRMAGGQPAFSLLCRKPPTIYGGSAQGLFQRGALFRLRSSQPGISPKLYPSSQCTTK